jgi:hypothetical protein
MHYIPSQTNHIRVVFKMKKPSWMFITEYQVTFAASPGTLMSFTFTSTANTQAAVVTGVNELT